MSELSSYPAAPNAAEFGPFGTYMSLVPAGNIRDILVDQLAEVKKVVGGIPEMEALRLHPPSTWTVHQVLGHITDAERVFGYRAMRLARLDPTPLPSFDENEYVKNATFNSVPLEELLAAFEHLRLSHIHMIAQFTPAAWAFKGTASNRAMTAAAMVYVIAGHTKHHLDILKKRLGK